ncbi:MAG TPA: methylisocitrate lyase [Nitrospiria bacterium]|nr:methylisocitrate lyase [Nitrospiria bacterium]
MRKTLSKAGCLRRLIKEDIVVMPGALNAATAMLVERCGFEAVYISGAGLAAGVAGLPDVGLLSLTEVAQQAAYIARAVKIPAIVDGETGFGGPLHVMRTVNAFEQAGLAGTHLEDQRMPKRCGHLTGKQLIPPEEMAEKIRAAVRARTDPDFLIIARTDARGVNGLKDAIRRGRCYQEAGADVIFPEALESAKELEEFARKVKAPLMANMTEFGRSPYLSVKEFRALGYRMVLFPMTALRVMMKAAEQGLLELKNAGTQKGLLGRMQTRQELYELLGYSSYEKADFELSRNNSRKRKRRRPI